MAGQPERMGTYGGFNRIEEEVPFRLFRFFDFSVESGRRYQYRVQLALYDPNHEVPQKYLSDTVISRREKLSEKLCQFRLTDWSEPSPVVSVPFPGRILAGPVQMPRADLHNQEPTATVLTKMFDQKEAVEGAAEIEKMRLGGVANFNRSTQVIKYE